MLNYIDKYFSEHWNSKLACSLVDNLINFYLYKTKKQKLVNLLPTYKKHISKSPKVVLACT